LPDAEDAVLDEVRLADLMAELPVALLVKED
jgi:hypothetical protein